MKKYFLLLLAIILFSCNKPSKHLKVNELYQEDVTALTKEASKLNQLVLANKTQKDIQEQFIATHKAYKKVEFLSEYYFPEVSKSLNGPALDEFEENDNKIIPPQGFQVIEELLFPAYDLKNKAELEQQLGMLKGNLIRLNKVSKNNQLTDAHVFDALRLEMFRIITLGITGFDSPIAQKSIPEAAVALETIKKHYALYVSPEKESKLFENAINYLEKNSDFNSFDRADFIINYANPISSELYKTQLDLNIKPFEEVRGLKTTAKTLFDKAVFDTEGFSGFPDYKTTKEKIALGKILFNDPILSGNNTRSCASCHYEDKAFTDGLTTAQSMDGKSVLKRNTPTLKNIAFQRSFFADSRVSYLEDQAVAVITNKDEMHGSLDEVALKIQKNKEYILKFNQAFPNKEINSFGIKNAIASYIRSLSNYDSKFDRYMRKETSFTKEEKNGFNLFAGKAKCASCHFIPLTNGTVPPKFDKTESEVLGVPNKKGTLDDDLGKFNLTRAIIHRNSFKTPTLRNIEKTAPYMHNGVFNTLEEVIEFYNKGGGVGLGFSVDNQTLPTDELNLSPKEEKELVSFMKTLTDK